MKNAYHTEILSLLRRNSGKPAKDDFLNSYLGNDHPRYPINTPTLRTIAKDWMRSHKDLSAHAFAQLVTSFVEAESYTEKTIAGIMLGYSTKTQRKFDPAIFDRWLDHLVGWAEVDVLCTGDFSRTELPAEWPKWKKLLKQLVKDPNIQKRRASLVLFCSPISRVRDERLAELAFQNIQRLKHEREVLITKAISWVLRSMVRHYRDEVADFVDENESTLPKIAIRETRLKLATGKKKS